MTSLREYGSLAAVWRMVRRTAFVQLRRSWLLLALTLCLLCLLFPLPPLLVALGIGLGFARAAGAVSLTTPWLLGLGSVGLLGWALQTAIYLRTVRHFGLPDAWAWTLPLAGTLYGCMTLDSARCDLTGGRGRW